MKSIRLATCAAVLCFATGVVAAQPAPPAVIAKCESCHGPNGNSAVPTTPRLNGQNAPYIVERLHDFLDPRGQDPHATYAMWGVARQIDDDTLGALADHFSEQVPTPPSPSGSEKLIALGQALYVQGNPAERVPACESCHALAGKGAGNIPRIAGQHGAYLKVQLERLRLNIRSSAIMHPNTNAMSDDEIAAVTAYLAND